MVARDLLEKWKRIDRRNETMTIRVSEETANIIERLALENRLAKTAVASDLLCLGLSVLESDNV